MSNIVISGSVSYTHLSGFLIFYIHFIHNSTKNIRFLDKKEGVLQLDVEILNITREIRLYTVSYTHLVLLRDVLQSV